MNSANREAGGGTGGGTGQTSPDEAAAADNEAAETASKDDASVDQPSWVDIFGKLVADAVAAGASVEAAIKAAESVVKTTASFRSTVSPRESQSASRSPSQPDPRSQSSSQPQSEPHQEPEPEPESKTPAIDVPETAQLQENPRKRLASWRNRALATYWELKAELDCLNIRLGERSTASARQQLKHAYERLRYAFDVASTPPPRGQRFRTMWRGSDIDSANLALHEVRAAIVQLTPDATKDAGLVIEAQERAAQLLKPKDSRLTSLVGLQDPLPAPESEKLRAGTMVKAAVALRAAYSANAAKHRQVRDFRNVLIAATVVLFVGAVLLSAVGWLWPTSLNLCWTVPDGADGGDAADTICPSGFSSPTGGDVALVSLLGLLGAAVTGAIAIRRLRGTSTPYGVPLWSVLIKLPIGALTAFLGLLLLSVVDSFTLTSQQAILAWALVFGVSQEAFTRLIDLQAQTVLDSVPTSAKDGGAGGTPVNATEADGTAAETTTNR
ncbi:hypothetical protein [Microbacterium hibisci]|uniref:hypothetical protein n=1 Tax=Microbacterium hibisci TaxID=2036000 RepID=UPI00194132E0|nr:hypothetical protein [Microbacterium hibisci]